MTRLSDLIRGESKHSLSIPRWLERLASIGIVTANPEIARRQRITNIGAFVAAGTTIGHLVINAVHDPGGLISVHIFNAVFALLALLIPNLHRYGENAAAVGLATLVLVGTVIIVWLLGTASHLQIYFTLIGALLLFVGVQNWKLFSAYFVLFTLALLLTLNYAPHDGLIMPQDKGLRDMLTNQAMINTITVNCVIIFYAMAALRRAELNLENEYARSEALVTTMIPASIATRLKFAPDQRIADHIECLSILFADLVGFTKAAHDLPPDQLVAYLDGLVCAFDHCASDSALTRSRLSVIATWPWPALTAMDQRGQGQSAGLRWQCWRPLSAVNCSVGSVCSCAWGCIVAMQPQV
jgi:adenylate cyclase